MKTNSPSWLMQDQRFHATLVSERRFLRHAPMSLYDNVHSGADASRKPRLEGARNRGDPSPREATFSQAQPISG